MKFCSHCGNELLDEAVVCPKCGCSVDNTYNIKKENNDINTELNNLATIELVLTIFLSLIGYIIGKVLINNKLGELGIEQSDINNHISSSAKTCIKASDVVIIIYIVLAAVAFIIGISIGLEILSKN